MKWIVATPSLPPEAAGPAQYAAGISEELGRRGLSVDVVAYGMLERSLPAGVRHLVYFLRIFSRLTTGDAVLALDTWSVGFPALFAARLLRRKFLVRIGGDFLWESYVERTGEEVLLSEFYTRPRALSHKERLARAAIRHLLIHADALLFTTSWQRDIWRAAYGFQVSRAHTLENFFPPREAGAATSTGVFVAAGRAIRLKNRERLIRVFARVQARHPEISLDERVLPPHLHRERVASCRAVIVSSLSEVSPNTVIDALHFGKPFIAPWDCGIREHVAQAGLFVDTRDEVALESALEKLADKKMYEQAAVRARGFSFERGWQDVVDDIVGIGERL